MPVRIYDISKKLGLENKEIISKAKALGITAAKVASSSLDKISAEYLEGELLKDHPDIAAKLNGPPVEVAPKPAPVEDKIVVITAPPPPPPVETLAEPAPTATATTTIEAEPPPPKEVKEEKEEIAQPAAAAAPPVIEPPKPAPTPAPAPAPVIPPKPVVPPPPPKPQVGEKVGFIQLPQKPQPKPVDKPGQKFPPQQRPQDNRGNKTEFTRRGDIRGVRGGPNAPTGPAMPGAKPPQKGPPSSGPKFSLPADAQVIVIKPPIVVRDLADQLKQKP